MCGLYYCGTWLRTQPKSADGKHSRLKTSCTRWASAGLGVELRYTRVPRGGRHKDADFRIPQAIINVVFDHRGSLLNVQHDHITSACCAACVHQRTVPGHKFSKSLCQGVDLRLTAGRVGGGCSVGCSCYGAMFEGGEGSAHHVEDVGRILLQVQDNLRGLRESLRSGTRSGHGGPTADGRADAVAKLDGVLERAEHDLRVKAEVVLNSVIQNTVRTLPTIKPSSADGSGATGAGLGATHGTVARTYGGARGRVDASGGLSPSTRRKRQALNAKRPQSDPKPASRVRDRMLEAQAFAHFDINNEDHRAFLRGKYGVPFRTAAERLDNRSNQRTAGVRRGGRRGPNKLTTANNLLPLKNRRDPQAPPPPVTNEDVRSVVVNSCMPCLSRLMLCRMDGAVREYSR